MHTQKKLNRLAPHSIFVFLCMRKCLELLYRRSKQNVPTTRTHHTTQPADEEDDNNHDDHDDKLTELAVCLVWDHWMKRCARVRTTHFTLCRFVWSWDVSVEWKKKQDGECKYEKRAIMLYRWRYKYNADSASKNNDQMGSSYMMFCACAITRIQTENASENTIR